MTKEEMNRLVATKIKEIKALNPDLNAVLLALHDENGSVVCAAGDCDKDHAAKVNENPKDPANKTTYLFLVYLTALVAKNAGIDWNTHVRIAMDADEMGLK